MGILEVLVPAIAGGTSQVKKRIGSYPRVRTEGSGRGAASQAGAVLLVETVRKSGLDQAISAALAPWRRPRAVHDPGKILLDVALAVALGGDCLADASAPAPAPCEENAFPCTSCPPAHGTPPRARGRQALRLGRSRDGRATPARAGSRAVGGRPGLFGRQLRVWLGLIRSRCHRSTVSGWTSNPSRRRTWRGSGTGRAARKARSSGANFTRPAPTGRKAASPD